MRLALTVPFSGIPLTELPPLVRRAEHAGYESLWSQEATELDGFTPLTVAALNTERMRLVTGIVSVYTRGPTLLAQSATALSELSGGRFVLGLGASSNVIVEQWNGIPFERPLARVSETVDYLRTVLAGERGRRLREQRGPARVDVHDAGDQAEPLAVLGCDGERREAVEVRRLRRPQTLVAGLLDPPHERAELVQRHAVEGDRDAGTDASVSRADGLARCDAAGRAARCRAGW